MCVTLYHNMVQPRRCESSYIGLTVLHGSGHASPADMQRLAAAVNPAEVVPVHTRQTGRYAALSVSLDDAGPVIPEVLWAWERTSV